MKKLLLLVTMITTQVTLAQGLIDLSPLPGVDNSKKEVAIQCTSRGSGSSFLSISFTSEDKLSELTSGNITAQGFNRYSFDINITDVEHFSDQLRFNFKGENIEGSFEINLVDGKPEGEGNIDLTQKPIVGAVVFNKYPLSFCSGKL